MIEGQDIICFCNDWDGDPLSKKHIMSRFAKRNRVLWVNSVGVRNPTASVYDLKRVVQKVRAFSAGHKKVTDSINVFTPLVIPFHGNSVARWVNRKVLRWSLLKACRRLGFTNPITWVFIPASAEVAGTLNERMLVYHCVDEYSEFSGTDKNALLALERHLIEKSNCVIVCSDRLLESKRKFNDQTYLVTHGVDVEHFRRACDPNTAIPDEMKALRKPVVGFFGLIADWVDLALIRFLADSRPEWNFVLLGKVTTNTKIVDGVSNVHLLGSKPYQQLPAYAKGFDVAILPFAVNELTLNSNPLKLREYLAAGLPVVSTAIPEAEKLRGALRVGHNNTEFLEHLEAIIRSGKTGPQIEISQAMDSESWDSKVEELSRIVTGLESRNTAVA
jgi:glycosyltransferase involved in cell wall biosynthesis